jgi:predicted outer membrane repeat protein
MTDLRRCLSVLASLAFGLGAAGLLLLSGSPVAAAPAAAPAGGNICFARDDSATGTVYGSGDAGALRDAALHAVPGDLVRLAGTCHGAVAQLGTTQTVALTRAVTLVGGYSPTDWNDSFPITQPTVLDAQNQGRVITASGDLTLANLTIQNGNAFLADGGGAFGTGNLTLVGAVSFLSNTTTGNTLLGPAGLSSPTDFGLHEGGGLKYEALRYKTSLPLPDIDYFDGTPNFVFANNQANGGGGAVFVSGDADLANITFSHNTSGQDGGALHVVGTLHLNNGQFDHDTATNGAGLYLESGATVQNILCTHEIAEFGGGCVAGISENAQSFTGFIATGNQAQFGSVGDFFGPLVTIAASKFSDNIATQSGTLNWVDTPGYLYNVSFIHNTAPEGQALSASRLFRSDEFPLIIAHNLALSTAGDGVPLAATSALTGSAFSTVGVSLDISDTILDGFPLDFQTDNSPSSTIRGDYNLFAATPVISGTGITTGTHSLVGNPLFADAAGHLSAGSPAIDNGINVGVNVDLDGNPRPSGHGFDIGPYEFQFPRLFLPLLQR